MQNIQSVEVNGAQPVKRLDGEVVKLGEIPYSAGTWFETWVGQWERPTKGRRGGVDEEKVEIEKVSQSLTTLSY